MNNCTQSTRNEERKEEKAPHSRIFIVCDRQLRENDLQPVFERFGTIEDLYMPRDRFTGESRGVAYIKFAKTSSAALAIQEMHLKILQDCIKPIKVMVATNRNENSNNSEHNYTRLFIKVPKEATQSEVREHFEMFGNVKSVFLQKDKLTDANKGFAYVQYGSFVDSATAFELCDRKYKPVFALPRDELKRSRNNSETNFFHSNSYDLTTDRYLDHYRHSRDDVCRTDNITPLLPPTISSYDSIIANCSPHVPQKYIEQLFNVVPGMTHCQYTSDPYNGICKSIITYEDSKAAAYAVERLNNFEFPSGELLSVKPNNNPLKKAANNLTDIVKHFKTAIDAGNPDFSKLVDAIAEASTLIKEATSSKTQPRDESQKLNYCNVDLPPPQPLADIESKVALRLFIVCKPKTPPVSILTDVFCRFGDLINISTFSNRIIGFVKYASVNSALEAIKVLNQAVVAGVRLKVMKADEKQNKEDEITEDMEQSEKSDHDIERKRMKLNND